MDERCDLCADAATTRCRRCHAPVCAFHGPWKAELACRRCEEVWDQARRVRMRATIPAAMIGLGVGAIVIMGGVVLAMELFKSLAHMQMVGFGLIVVMFGGPIMVAIRAARWAERRLRLRFLANGPPPVPLAKVVRSPASPSDPS